MGWCFAIVNEKLAEIYFEKQRGKTKILGHTYVKRGEYKTKKEQKYIDEDIAKFQFMYIKGTYKDILKPGKIFEWVVTAAGMGTKAALDVEEYLEHQSRGK